MPETQYPTRAPRRPPSREGELHARPQPRSVRTSQNDEVLRSAMVRADEAFAMLDRIERRTQRNRRARTLHKSIIQSQKDRQRSLTVLRAFFFGNFVILGLIFMLGAGPTAGSLGEIMTGVARACALVGTYLILVQLLLVARIPFLDRIYGHDRLTRIHKVNGHISFDLIVFHAFFVVAGRAWLNDISIPTMAVRAMSLAYMPHAVVGFAMMVIAIVTSAHAAKRKVGHDRWHFLHKWTYLGTLLSFGHLLPGPDFDGRPIPQMYMGLMFAATFFTIFHFRIVIPFQRAFKHQLHVRKVVEEGPGITSVYMAGFHLDQLKIKAGQFFYWRFLTRGHWNSAHPYSISTAPNNKFLRITVKSLGDHSGGIGSIPLGTWVTFEGPFGRFTSEKRTQLKTVLVAGGIGVTPIRSLLEGMEFIEGDLAVIYRANSEADAVLLNEIEELAMQKKAELHVVLGPSSAYEEHYKPLGPNHLRSLIPDIGQRDIFICASPGMTKGVCATLKSMGVPTNQVHYEAFA